MKVLQIEELPPSIGVILHKVETCDRQLQGCLRLFQISRQKAEELLGLVEEFTFEREIGRGRELLNVVSLGVSIGGAELVLEL